MNVRKTAGLYDRNADEPMSSFHEIFRGMSPLFMEPNQRWGSNEMEMASLAFISSVDFCFAVQAEQ
jgi:hypothetical protein